MVFWVGQFNYASHIWLGHTLVAMATEICDFQHIWLGDTLVAMATKICDFQHKIGYNSVCAGDTPKILAPTRGFSGSANLMVSVKFCSDYPCCQGDENLKIWTENSP